MSVARLFLFSLGITIMGACGGPESTGVSGAGGRGSFAAGQGGSSGTSSGSIDTTGTGGDISATGGGGVDDVGSDADIAEPSDASPMGEASTNDSATNDAPRFDATTVDASSDVRDAGVDAPPDAPSDARFDAPVDANTRDVVTTDACMAMPQQDGQCRNSSRGPHRYVCPISIGTPNGCERTGTAATTATYCCP